MQSFDWDGFNKLLTRPSSALVGRLVRCIRSLACREHWVAALPQHESELTAYLRRLLPAGDWYGGKTPAEANAIDRIVDKLFDYENPLRPMKLEPLGNGVMNEIIELATGRFLLDEGRNTSRARALYVTQVQPPPVADSSKLAELGSRPHRHPSWNRKIAWELCVLNNPFIQGADAAYFPNYSVHSPEQVEVLRQELTRVGDRLRRELDRVKSKSLRIGVIANLEVNLVAAIEKAARSRRAVWARSDY
jgi:hypothetical protein